MLRPYGWAMRCLLWIIQRKINMIYRKCTLLDLYCTENMVCSTWNEIQCSCSAVITRSYFFLNTQNGYPMTCPQAWGMGCLVWVQSLIYVLTHSLQCFVEYDNILNQCYSAAWLHVHSCVQVWYDCIANRQWFMWLIYPYSPVLLHCEWGQSYDLISVNTVPTDLGPVSI